MDASWDVCVCVRARYATRVTYAAEAGAREGGEGRRMSGCAAAVSSSGALRQVHDPLARRRKGDGGVALLGRPFAEAPRHGSPRLGVANSSGDRPRLLQKRKCAAALWLLPLLDVITTRLPCDAPACRRHRMAAPTRKTTRGPALCSFPCEVSLR